MTSCCRQSGSDVIIGVQHSASCDQIHYVTTHYLAFTGAFILSLVVLVIILGLGFIMTLCTQYCVPKDGRYSHSTSMATIGNGSTMRYNNSAHFFKEAGYVLKGYIVGIQKYYVSDLTVFLKYYM